MNDIIKIIGKILHIGFSFFLIWQTIMLLNKLSINQSAEFPYRLLDALFLNLFVTGVFTIVYSFPIYKLLPDGFYNINNPKLFKSFCNIIHIELYRKLLLLTLWRKKQNKEYYFNGARSGFKGFEINLMKAEFGHFFGFTITVLLTFYIGIQGNLLTATIAFLINIIFNFYPFILQRNHQLRLNRLINICN
jgi:hypothetical protein